MGEYGILILSAVGEYETLILNAVGEHEILIVELNLDLLFCVVLRNSLIHQSTKMVLHFTKMDYL